MSYCRFCEMIEKNAYDIIYSDRLYAASLDNCPKNVGHFLIFTRRHISSVFDLTDEEMLEGRRVLDRVLKNFPTIDFIGRYRHFISLAPDHDKKVIERCNNAIEFINRESQLVPSGFSYGVNEGMDSGKEHDHLHMHVVPAYTNSNNRRGFRFLF